MTRKEMKKRAKKVLKGHYWLLLMLCLVASFIGVEASGSLDFVQSYDSSKAAADEEGGVVSTGATMGRSKADISEVIAEAALGRMDEAQELSDSITEEAVEDTKERGNRVLGRSRGVFAGIVNGFVSGNYFLFVAKAVKNVGMAPSALLAILIFLALLGAFLVWFFFINIFQAISRRVFLECRTYEKVSVERCLLFSRVKRWKRVAVTMFMNALLYSLWSLTIIGGVIKRYSYFLVPYITAENPDIHWKDAITLSRRIMNGHKWECFVLELSFLPWELLGTITGGIANVFFVNPYRVAVCTEYYANLRKKALLEGIPGSELLNDRYLHEIADRAALEGAYQDIVELEKAEPLDYAQKGFLGKIADVFGISLRKPAEEKIYMEERERRQKLDSAALVMSGKAYPDRLFPIPKRGKDSRPEHMHYLRNYSIPSLILIYFIMAFGGWLWEVSLHLLTDGCFVNRGVLHGPWLPIYGTGSLLILTLLNKFRKKPYLEFLATVIVCGCVEYFTAYYLEMTHDGQKWWDYSGYFLNLHGRICAEGLLIFGLGGMAIVYFLAPVIDNHIRKLKLSIAVPLCIVLLLVFAGDEAYSGKNPNTGAGITDYEGACLEQAPGNSQIEQSYALSI